MERARVSRVEVKALLEEVLRTHATKAKDRRVTIATELADVSRDTDRDKLRVLVENVIDNAVSYVDEGGRIDIQLTATGLEVTNTGCELTDAAKVFERFWRGDKARSDRSHGGVGLALCKKLAELIGGSIEATVDDGRFAIALRFGELPAER